MMSIPFSARLAAVGLASLATVSAQGLTVSGQVVSALESTTYDSCSQTTTSQSIPVGPLPASVSLPGFSWGLTPTGLTMAASGTANICGFFAPAGSFERNGTVEITLTAPFETTVRIQMQGTYSATGGFAFTQITGAATASLGGFFGPTTSLLTNDTVRVGPAGTTLTIDHSCAALANPFVSIQSNVSIDWSVVNAASTESYGSGCGPVLTATTLPRLGTVMNSTVAAVPGPVPVGVVAVGVAEESLSLASIGMPSCTLLQSADLVYTATSTSATTLGLQISLPPAATLVGINLFTQAFVLAPGVNPLGLSASNGVRWQLGT